MRKYLLTVFLVCVIVMSGCQPMEPTDTSEMELLKEQNQILSQQLLESQKQILDLQSQIKILSTQVAQLPEPIQEGGFEGLGAEILAILQAKDFPSLASFVHPQVGLRFSPQLFIHTNTDLVFTREQVANFALDNAIYTWGTHAAKGDLLEKSVNAYWDEYVIPLLPEQDWSLLDEGEKTPSIAIDNFFDVYPRGHYVDFLKSGTEEFGNMDWQSLRLVFEQATDGAYYLAGIIHDNWVP